MSDILFRCSSIGKLMTEPKTKAEGPLSVGAKTYIRELAAQEIFGVEFEFSSKETEKGIEVEDKSIALLNRVRGLQLIKNTQRLDNGIITGECDLFDKPRRRGHDLKSSWSIKTFPGWVADCENKLYEWQMRGYMALYDAGEWEVNYALVNTPERLIGYEPLQLHIVEHIPEWMRLTTWTIERDLAKEAQMMERCMLAREYMKEVLREFDQYHTLGEIPAWHDEAPPPIATTPAPIEVAALPELF